jgi:hypothetical protein
MPLRIRTNNIDRMTFTHNSDNIGVGTGTPSRTFHISGTSIITSWTGINFSSAGKVTPTAPLEVSGTISATAFVGDGSGLTNLPGGGGATDNITSGTATVVANSNTGISVSAPLEVSGDVNISGTMKVAGTGSETCDSSKYGLIRRNPTTGALQMCVSR